MTSDNVRHARLGSFRRLFVGSTGAALVAYSALKLSLLRAFPLSGLGIYFIWRAVTDTTSPHAEEPHVLSRG